MQIRAVRRLCVMRASIGQSTANVKALSLGKVGKRSRGKLLGVVHFAARFIGLESPVAFDLRHIPVFRRFSKFADRPRRTIGPG